MGRHPGSIRNKEGRNVEIRSRPLLTTDLGRAGIRMGATLPSATKTDETPMTDKPTPKSLPPSPLGAWSNTILDSIAMIVVGALIYTDKISAETGMALLAALVMARLPPKGGGVATVLLPMVLLLKNRGAALLKLIVFGAILFLVAG